MSEEHDEQEEHLDEKWLVSYADMMTLLFGLFVMLFSIASENQGHFKEQLQKISDSTFNKEVTEVTPEKVVVPVAPPEKPDLTQELDTVKKEKTDLEKKLQEKELLQVNLKNQIEEKIQSENELKKTVEKINAEKKLIEDKILNQKVTKTVDPEKLILEKQKKDLQAELQEVQKKLIKEQQKSSQSQRQVASLDEKDEQVKDLTKEQEKLKLEKAKLEKQLSSLQDDIKSQSQFMMVVLKWTSEKHDLDLTVTDPSGKVFNFKNRKYAGSSGEFTLDSRSGPGAEIWQTDKIKPGTYTVTWKLYNTYGNEKPVVFSGFVSSNRSRVEIVEARFEAKVGTQQSVKIKADEKGNLTKLN